MRKLDLSNFDIEGYLEKKGVEIYSNVKNVSSGWIGINCPFCDDKSWHLGISKSNAINCYRCNTKGTILKLIMKIEKCNYDKAVEIITEKKSHTPIKSKSEKISSKELPTEINLNHFTRKLLPAHKDYLEKKRGFNAEKIYNEFGLLSAYLTGNYRYSIIAPYYQNEKILTFVSMDITEEREPKYRNLPDSESIVPIKNLLYNYKERENIAIIVEGVTDVWRIGKGCFGLLGKKATPAQKLLISRIKKPFIMLDADAQSEATRLASEISSLNSNVEIIELSSGDPCDLPEDELNYLRKTIFGRD